MTPPVRLFSYVGAVVAVGLAALTWVALSTQWEGPISADLGWPLAFLIIAAIAGEVLPVEVTGVDGQRRTLSASAPFVLALIAVSGVAVAVAVQLVASLADDLMQHRTLTKSVFNSGQYAISVVAGGVTFAALAGIPIFGPREQFHAGGILPLLAAGVAMIALNWSLVAGAISIVMERRFLTVIREDVRDYLVVNVVLLSVGAIAALITAEGVGALLLLAAPVVAAHFFAAAAARHARAAVHDQLTGLGNRTKLIFALEHALEESRTDGRLNPALVLLDLDHFRDINDSLGHPVGDEILCVVAERLTQAAPDGAAVHRLGGDEFAVVIAGDSGTVRQAAHDLAMAFDSPVQIEELELLVRASVGVAHAPEHGTDFATLMKNADIALYQAKIERDGVVIFSPGLDVNSVEKLKILAELRAAIDNNELQLVYQPQVDLATNRTVGIEALVRWQHPERGLVPPDEFIPLAENSGVIFHLTAYVLNTALDQARVWRDAGHDIRIAVNLSARHLSDLALPDNVWDAAIRNRVPLDRLVLEVTETGILSDPARADTVIRSLRELGVEVSIDDYGTGHASLSYLKRLEVDELKIDRSFVSNILTDDHDRAIVRSTIALATELGLRIVAEGIEDEETTAILRDLPAVIGQGFHLGRPVDSAAMTHHLDSELRAAALAKDRP